MHLAVFGATGRTGVQLVMQALARGHSVTALVRSASRAGGVLPVASSQLRLSVGSIVEPRPVQATLVGADAVVDVSGPGDGAPSDLRQQAGTHLLAAMDAAGVSRLVAVVGAGVRVEGDAPGTAGRARGAALKVAQPRLLADASAYVDLLAASDRAWTAVRVPRLVDADPRELPLRVSATAGRGSWTKVGRADLAAFLLDVVEHDAWIRQAPIVSW